MNDFTAWSAGKLNARLFEYWLSFRAVRKRVRQKGFGFLIVWLKGQSYKDLVQIADQLWGHKHPAPPYQIWRKWDKSRYKLNPFVCHHKK